MKNTEYNILDELEEILSTKNNIDEIIKLGDNIFALVYRVLLLMPGLDNAYSDAVEKEDWEKALYLYQLIIGCPGLIGSVDRDKYIQELKPWIKEAEDILLC